MKYRKFTALLLALLMSFSLLTGCAEVRSEIADAVVDEIVDVVVSEIETALASPAPDKSAAETQSPAAPADTPEPQKAEESPAPSEAPAPAETPAPAPSEAPEPEIDEDGEYTSKDEVALYIHTYGHLPENFITKKEAQSMGWTGGSLDPYYYGGSIGGDYFGNYEGQLPKAPGRKWTECDINTMYKKSRGAERIVFSNDGLIYYTGDHYESFVQLY